MVQAWFTLSIGLVGQVWPMTGCYRGRFQRVCELIGSALEGQYGGPLVVLGLLGLGDLQRQVHRLLEEEHQCGFCQQGGQDLGKAHHPVLLPLLFLLGLQPFLSWLRLFLAADRPQAAVSHLADLQHQAGNLGDGLEEVALASVPVEHAVQRLAELDELSLGGKNKVT